MLVQLRDGRKIIGILRSFDQFANIVLEEAVERVVVGKRFADVPLGLYVIRGENVVLLGQIVRADDPPTPTAMNVLAHRTRQHARRPTRCDARAPLPRARARPPQAHPRCLVRRSLPPLPSSAQDDAQEERTTKELLTEAPIEELLEEKRQAEEALRLKANLSRAATRAAVDPWDELG